MLERIAQMGSWQPHYVDLDPSQERLAEMVLKLEREVYGSKRPHQLANRDVFLRIGDPIDLGASSRATWRIRRRSAAGSLNDSGT